MPRGSKDVYTDKQKRKAEHIEEGYEKRGLSAKNAAARAWATVNKQDGGGQKRRAKASPKKAKVWKKASKAVSNKAAKKQPTARRRTKAKARRTTKARRTRTATTKARASSKR